MKCKQTNYINRKHKTNINIQIYIAMWAHFLQSKCDATYFPLVAKKKQKKKKTFPVNEI